MSLLSDQIRILSEKYKYLSQKKLKWLVKGELGKVWISNFYNFDRDQAPVEFFDRNRKKAFAIFPQLQVLNIFPFNENVLPALSEE